MRRIPTTLIIILLTITTYFLFSNTSLYIQQDALLNLSFHWKNIMPGLITYEFAHIGLKHLFGNMFLLLLVGLIAEIKLTRKDYLAIYFLSGAVGAISFAIINPQIALVGASACIAGIMVPAMVISIRKLVLGLILLSLFSTTLLMPTIDTTSQYLYTRTLNQQQALTQLEQNISNQTQDLITTLENITQTQQQTEQQLAQGQINQTQYQLIITRLLAQKNQSLSQLAQAEQEKQTVLAEQNKTLEIKENLSQGIQREKAMATSLIVHALGSITGAVYLLAFRRDIIKESAQEWSQTLSKIRERL